MVDGKLDYIGEPSVEVVDVMQFPNSVYSACELNGKTFVGGGDWDRRGQVFSGEIAEKAGGVLSVVGADGEVEKEERFPSMIYTVVPVPEHGVAFVGCKLGQGMYNLVDSSGNIVLSRDEDGSGDGGVYNAFRNPNNGLILCTKRNGWVVSRSSRDLREIAGAKLAHNGTRLWSLAYDAAKDVIYTGDYDGVFSAVKCAQGKVGQLDLKNFYRQDDRFEGSLSSGLVPSLWGLEIMSDGNVVLGDRWGRLNLVRPDDMQLLDTIEAPDGITSLLRMQGDLLLVGTRYGKLYSFDFNSRAFNLVHDSPPVLQQENPIWGMSRVGENEALVSIADGEVVRVKVS